MKSLWKIVCLVLHALWSLFMIVVAIPVIGLAAGTFTFLACSLAGLVSGLVGGLGLLFYTLREGWRDAPNLWLKGATRILR